MTGMPLIVCVQHVCKLRHEGIYFVWLWFISFVISVHERHLFTVLYSYVIGQMAAAAAAAAAAL